MALTAEQIAEARKEGYSDAEILKHYATSQGIDLKAAQDEGYSDAEILSHFSGADVEPMKAGAGEPGMLNNPMLSGALGAGAGAAVSAKTIPVKAAKALGNVVADKLRPPPEVKPPIPNAYTTPSGINVEQTPGGLHPGAVGNAQFNVEQQQANTLRQNMPSGFEQRGTSRIMTPVGMPEAPPAALGGASKPSGTFSAMGSRALSAPTQAIKQAAPAIGGAAKGLMTSLPVAGALAGYNLQQAENRRAAGDDLGAGVGYAGAASQFIPKVKGKLGLIKPLLGVGAAGFNALRGEPTGYAGGGKVDLLQQAIKSAKQMAREAGYVHDIVPTHQFSTPKQLSIQELQGKTLVGVPGDRTLTGHEVRSVNRVPLSKPVEQQGGPMYGLRQQDLGNPHFWASNDSAAIALQNKARRAQQQHGNDVFGIYTAMAPDAGNYALHTTETLLNQIPAMNPRKKDIAAFDKMIRQQFPSFAGVTDPDVLEQLARDSKMRKFLAERLNKTTVAEQYGMPSGEATIHAITEPALRDVPTGNTGFTLGRLHPEKELTPNIDVSHGTYNTNIPGEFQGQMIAQVPWQMYFPDAAKQIAANPKQAPHAWGTFKMGDYNQPVTQELVDTIAPLEEAILAGKQHMAEGGAVNMAGGGKLKGGLSMMPTSQRTDMRNMGQTIDQFADADTYNKAKMLYNSPAAQAALMGGSMVNPAMAIGVGGSEILKALNEGEYGDAALYGGLSSLPFAKPMMQAARKVPGMFRGAPQMPGMMSNMVPAMAGGGDVLKALRKVMGAADDVGGVGARAIEGSPHSYPPIAEGPWMREYQPATNAAGLPTTREGWDALGEQSRMAQIRAEQELGRAGPVRPSAVQYMGKYRQGTPEERALQRQSDNDTIRMLMKLRGME